MGKVLRRTNVRAGVLVMLALSLFSGPTASAGDPQMPIGRFKECRAPWASCESVIRDGSVIKIVDQHRYRFKKESEWRKGRYRLNDEYRIRFKTGPLHNQLSNEDYKCTYRGDIICEYRHVFDAYRGWKYVD